MRMKPARDQSKNVDASVDASTANSVVTVALFGLEDASMRLRSRLVEVPYPYDVMCSRRSDGAKIWLAVILHATESVLDSKSSRASRGRRTGTSLP